MWETVLLFEEFVSLRWFCNNCLKLLDRVYQARCIRGAYTNYLPMIKRRLSSILIKILRCYNFDEEALNSRSHIGVT